jgi:GTP-binding protein
MPHSSTRPPRHRHQPPSRTERGARTAPPADPLPVRSVEFIGGMAEAGGWRPEPSLPEVAFVGRSNVGKSALINRLVRRASIARVSRTPGRTRAINFFRINDEFVLADLPGYGYARVSKDLHAGWQPLVESYVKHSPQLRGIVVLLDVRREPTADDHAMLDFLAASELPTLVAVTKLDKLSPAASVARVARATADLGLDEDQVIATSAKTGQGRDELAAAVVDLVNAARQRPLAISPV